jgi:hypothetical protein
MALSTLRKHHLLTRALPPRTDAEHEFMVTEGHCEFCYGKLPQHLDVDCPATPLPPFLVEAPALVPPANVTTITDHALMPLSAGTPIHAPDPTPDPPPPAR